jgi:hypothetical protein
MLGVVAKRRKADQLLRLRAVAIEQVHRTALVNYLRDYSVVGAARDRILSEFYGLVDPRSAAVMEHRNYLVSASSQISALDVLDSARDRLGVRMIENYEVTYGQFFRMFCERALAEQSGLIYILSALIEEVNDSAVKMRKRILKGELLPVDSMRRRPLPLRR